MVRNLKALGLAFVAVFAMSAVAAAGAQAQATFNGSSATGVLGVEAASPTQDFTVPGVGVVECETVDGDYEGATEVETVTLTNVEYNNCTAFGFEANVTFNSCDYEFHAGTPTGAGSTGSVDIKCAVSGDVIEIETPICTVEVGAQSGLTDVNYNNNEVGGKEAILLGANVNGIAYSGGCGSGNNASYEGEAQVTGEDTIGNPIDLTVE